MLVERKGSSWSVHQNSGKRENILMELVEIWLAEKGLLSAVHSLLEIIKWLYNERTR